MVRSSLVWNLRKQADLAEVATSAWMDELGTRGARRRIGRRRLVPLRQLGGHHRLAAVKRAGETIRGVLGQGGRDEDEAPRPHRHDGLRLTWIRARGNGQGLEESVLGLDARALARSGGDEPRALRAARDGGEAGPPRAATPEGGRAAVPDHGRPVARSGTFSVEPFVFRVRTSSERSVAWMVSATA